MDRYAIPRWRGDETAQPIIDKVEQLAQETTVRTVRVTYWRNDEKLSDVLCTSQNAHGAVRNYPPGTTHLTIEP